MVSVFIHAQCIVIIMTVYLIVYTLYNPNLLWEHHKIMLCMWLTINLLVGVTSTSCSLEPLEGDCTSFGCGYDTVQGQCL